MVSTTTARSSAVNNLTDNTDGNISAAKLRSVFAATLDAVDTAADKISQISGELTAPGNRSYAIDLATPYPYLITSLAVQSTAGTCTVAVQINGTNVTGLAAVAVTTALNTVNATAANTVPVNGKVTLVVSNVAGASEAAYSLRYIRS